MRPDQPLTALHRLGLRRGPAGAAPVGGDVAADDAADDAEDPFGEPAPAWAVDRRAGGPRAWLDAVRADPGRAGGLALGAVAALAVLVTVFTLVRSHPAPVSSADLPPVRTAAEASAPDTSSAPSPSSPPGSAAVVSVVGLVQQPGLVTLAPEARVADAVAAAGGPLRGADTVGLNLARRIADGEQIVVGMAAPAGQAPALGSGVSAQVPAASGPASAQGPAAPGPVNLNTATAEQLDTLPGVGPVTAAAIIAWRQAHGRFADVDQLAEVDGIGPARLEKLRRFVTA